MKTWKTIFPLYLWEVAKLIWPMRAKKNTWNKWTKYDVDDKEKSLDIQGVWGELVVLNDLYQRNIPCTSEPLCQERPVHKPDVTVGEAKIDVKWMFMDTKRLTVNVDNYKKANKGITHFLWIQQEAFTNNAKYWCVDYKEVANWEVQEKHGTRADGSTYVSKFYAKPLDEIGQQPSQILNW